MHMEELINSGVLVWNMYILTVPSNMVDAAVHHMYEEYNVSNHTIKHGRYTPQTKEITFFLY